MVLRTWLTGTFTRGFCVSLLTLPCVILLSTLSVHVTMLIGIALILLAMYASIHSTVKRDTIPLTATHTRCDILRAGGVNTEYLSTISTSKHISNVMLAGFIIWYLTMLLPVNVEEKLTVPEILFYHFVLLSILLLFRRLRTVHEDKVRRFSSASHLLQYSPEQELSTPKSGTKHDSISSLSPILWYNPLLGLWMFADINWWFVALLSLYLFFAVYTANLALTSVCTPRMYADWFILPNDCTAVYADFLRAWVFVSSFYWLISTIVPTAVFIHQVVSLVQHCKKSSSGAHKDYVIA